MMSTLLTKADDGNSELDFYDYDCLIKRYEMCISLLFSFVIKTTYITALDFQIYGNLNCIRFR